jgi:vacuolar-type H+-ATPase subunit I/STV1
VTEVFGALLKAGSLGIDLATGRAKAGLRRLMRQAVVGSATLGLLLLAFGFALAAFAVWLSRQIGAVPALGFIGLGFLILALLVYGIAALTDKRRPRRRPPPPPIAESMRREFTAAGAAGEEPPAGSTVGSLAVVALVGYILARQLFRR